MKHIIYFLVVFGALLAHAQEMDTTFFVNEQGQTIGIVKPKEEQPAPAPAPVAVQQPQQNTDGSSWNSSPFEKPVQQQSAASYGTQARPAAYYAFDSTFYYQDKIDRFTKSGESKRSTGSGLMIGGAIGTAVGVALMVAGASDLECEEHYNGYSYEETCDDGAGTFVAGYLLTLGGVTVFSTGLIVRIVGGSKLRKAERYKEMLNRYNMYKPQAAVLQIKPVWSPLKGTVGGEMSLGF
jgi:hypothetical protein